VRPSALVYVPLLVMPVAFVLLAGAFTAPSPTAVGGEKLLHRADAARGMLRVTRHPFLWSAVLWSGSHFLVAVDPASWIFFGSLGVTALWGTFDIDRKRRRAEPEAFARFEAVTSNVPLQAVLEGRARLVARELWWPIALGLTLAIASALLHPYVFRASALPEQ
jgi:uncharacterized membrane protein